MVFAQSYLTDLVEHLRWKIDNAGFVCLKGLHSDWLWKVLGYHWIFRESMKNKFWSERVDMT